MAHFVNGFVNGRVFCDICVGLRDIGFGLVVIVIGYEILYCIFREKRSELTVELCRERFIGCYHKARSLELLYYVGHSEGLA